MKPLYISQIIGLNRTKNWCQNYDTQVLSSSQWKTLNVKIEFGLLTRVKDGLAKYSNQYTSLEKLDDTWKTVIKMSTHKYLQSIFK